MAIRSTRKVRASSRSAVESDRIPIAVAEPKARHVHVTFLTAVVEPDRRPLADRIEEERKRSEAVDRTKVDQRCRLGSHDRFAARAQFQQGITADRLAEVDSGDRQVQGGLLLGFQSEVGQVVRVGFDAVPELILTVDGDHQDWNSLVTKESFVPFECLTPGSLGVGVARHPIGDLRRLNGCDVSRRTNNRSVTRSSRSRRCTRANLGSRRVRI